MKSARILYALALVWAAGCFEESRFEGVALDAGRGPDARPDAALSDAAPDADADPVDAAPDADADPVDAAPDADADLCPDEPALCSRAGEEVCDGAIARSCVLDARGCLAFDESEEDCSPRGDFCVVRDGIAVCQQSPCTDGRSFYCPDPVGAPTEFGTCDSDGAPIDLSLCEEGLACDPDAAEGCGGDDPACKEADADELVCDDTNGSAPFERVRCQRKAGAATLEALEERCDAGAVCVQGACESHECDAIGSSCDGAYEVEVCSRDERTGRREFTERTCPLGEVCERGECEPDPENCQGFSVGDKKCDPGGAPDRIVTCEDVGGGRLVWDSGRNCSGPRVCEGDPGSAQCRNPSPCINTCTQAEWTDGLSRCSPTTAGTFESCDDITIDGSTCYQWVGVGFCLGPATPELEGCASQSRGVFCDAGGCEEYACADASCEVTPPRTCSPVLP